MDQSLNPCRKTLFLRLSAIVFFGELAHGMLLYGIIPEIIRARFPAGISLFGVLPVKAELAGLCIAAYVLAELAFKLPAGHWADARGPDAPIRVGLLVSLATVPVILLSREPGFMLLGSFLHGLGAAPIWPAVISSWTRGRSARERGEIMGQILTVWMAGLGLGVILGNILVGLTGRAELLATYAPVAMWVAAVVAALWTGQRLGYPASHGAAAGGEGQQPLRISPELRTMAVGLFIQNLAFGALIIPFNFLAVEHLKLSPLQFGLMVGLGGGPAVLLLGPLGKLADRMGRRRAVVRSMVVVAPLIAAAPVLTYLRVDSPEFGRRDLRRPAELAARLRSPSGPLDRYLAGQLAPEAAAELARFDGAAPPPASLRQGILAALNGAIRDPGLYAPDRFRGVELSEEARRLAVVRPRGEERLHFHRLLLQDAYAGEIGPRFPLASWLRFGILVFGVLLAGLAYAFLLPAWHALALGRIPEHQRGRSLALLMSIEMVALAGGHVLGPSIYEKVSFAGPFLFAGATFGLLALVYRLGYILPEEVHEELHPVDLNGGGSPNGARPGEAPSGGAPTPTARSGE